MNINISEIDHKRFGIVTAKADDFQSVEDVHRSFAYCGDNRVTLFIARVDTGKLDVVHAMESAGGILCDTLIHYELRIRKNERVQINDVEFIVRQMESADRTAVLATAREAFSGYFGHYHSDSRLNKADCDEVYVSWCQSAIDNIGSADDALVVERNAEICGFLILRRHEKNGLELVLSGIKKSYTGQGVYRRLIQAGIRYAVDRQMQRVFTSTQISNLATQRTWILQGFMPIKSVHTFHVWW